MRFDLSDDEWALLEPLMPEEPKERSRGRSNDYECDLLRAARRDAVARSTRALWAVHDGLQSLQPKVSTRHLEADF